MMEQSAISIKNISKSFKVSREIGNSLFGLLENLFKRKKYKIVRAVEDISLEIKKGEVVGIIGRNGSGKTTLAKIICGIYEPDKGQVEVNGHVSPVFTLGLGFNPELTGEENIYLNGALMGLSELEIKKSFNRIVEFAELKDFVYSKIKTYSSGMQMRLAFSVVRECFKDILIIDEALSVGDREFTEKCKNFFIDLKKNGKTMILISHNLSYIKELCNKCIYLKNGKVEFYGDTESAIKKYLADL